MTTTYRTRDLSRLTVSDLRAFAGSQWSRKLAHNTWVEQLPHADLAIRFHSTRILTFHVDGSFTINTQGWQTVTTKQRLNALLPSGYGVHQKAYRWYLSTPDGTFPYVDGTWNAPKPAPVPNPFGEFEDVHYGDIKPGDHVWDRTVSRWVRVVDVQERNAVTVELQLWGGNALVAELDTLIARRLPIQAQPVGYMEMGPNGFDLHLFAEGA